MVENNSTIRLAKYIASSGFYSRKEAEDLITAGKVKINGVIYKNFVIEQDPELLVEVENKVIKPSQEIIIYKFHKIAGTVTTARDPENRLTIYDSIRKKYSLPYTLKTVGRLDYNTEGLLLLTNQGEVARALELPINNFERLYEIEMWGHHDLKLLEQALSRGVSIEGISYKPIKMEVISSKIGTHRICLTLNEGKNREIRKILANFNFRIKSLKRIKFGPITLSNLPPEEITEISKTEYAQLSNLLHDSFF
jgi:23S rRNA pseudouridine2605 synthase